jgi:hypothetical protein
MVPAIGTLSRKIEWQLLEERRVDRVIGADEDDGVTIRRRCQRRLHANVAACADPVLDDELLPEIIGKILPDDPRNDVVGAARGETNDPMHRAVWIHVCRRDAWQKRERSSPRCEMQKLAASHEISSIALSLLQ